VLRPLKRMSQPLRCLRQQSGPTRWAVTARFHHSPQQPSGHRIGSGSQEPGRPGGGAERAVAAQADPRGFVTKLSGYGAPVVLSCKILCRAAVCCMRTQEYSHALPLMHAQSLAKSSASSVTRT